MGTWFNFNTLLLQKCCNVINVHVLYFISCDKYSDKSVGQTSYVRLLEIVINTLVIPINISNCVLKFIAVIPFLPNNVHAWLREVYYQHCIECLASLCLFSMWEGIFSSLYFGHLMRRVDSLEKTLMLGGIGGRRRRGRQRMRWLDVNTDSMDMGLVKLRELWWTGRPGVLRFMRSQRVRHHWATELNWTEPWARNVERIFQEKLSLFSLISLC